MILTERMEWMSHILTANVGLQCKLARSQHELLAIIALSYQWLSWLCLCADFHGFGLSLMHTSEVHLEVLLQILKSEVFPPLFMLSRTFVKRFGRCDVECTSGACECINKSTLIVMKESVLNILFCAFTNASKDFLLNFYWSHGNIDWSADYQFQPFRNFGKLHNAQRCKETANTDQTCKRGF